ncbi:MAG TPA: LegC family aminotransferase, partial [Candidatus Marinimicrobia bacterium]|nr:LegC family aminotransferase [Candidatus Neomarinimicrobiota bacterium]
MIPLSVPHISGNEWQYIKECLDTGWVSSIGKYVDAFESAICGYTGVKYAVASTNGTAALQIALKLVGVLPDDEVIVPTVTFIAPVNAVHFTGARPVFMDCDQYYNIDVNKTVEFIKQETIFKNGYKINKTTNSRIPAIIPVHIFGNAVDLEPLVSICKERNIKIVEDAAESLGTHYINGNLNGRHTGTVGDIGCYSFNGNKIITSGGGGMIVTNNESLAERAKYLTTQAKDDPLRYIHNEIGYNFRLTNIQAAMGVAQLEKLSEFIKTKQHNFQKYKNKIDDIPGLHIAEVPDYAINNCWMYALQIKKETYGNNRDELMNDLVDSGIQARPV